MPKYEISFNCGFHVFKERGQVRFTDADRAVVLAFAANYLMTICNAQVA